MGLERGPTPAIPQLSIPGVTDEEVRRYLPLAKRSGEKLTAQSYKIFRDSDKKLAEKATPYLCLCDKGGPKVDANNDLELDDYGSPQYIMSCVTILTSTYCVSVRHCFPRAKHNEVFSIRHIDDRDGRRPIDVKVNFSCISEKRIIST